jgi:hypothetical protein
MLLIFINSLKENDLISRRFFSPEQIAYMSSINILKSNKLSQFCCDWERRSRVKNPLFCCFTEDYDLHLLMILILINEYV